jgi:O-antigen ligase
MTIDHPLLGVGINNFQNFYPIYTGRDDELNHAHNLVLNVAAERGLFGLVAFCLVAMFLLASLVRTFTSARSLEERAVVAGLSASLAAYFIHSLFDVSYYDYKVLLLFWLLVGVGASLGGLTKADPSGAVSRPPKGTLQRTAAR